ncbi:DNA polymerase III subunit delta' [Acuticoccus sp. I52.16.1]|uniref:DNA polymerase III subunit delta' n=1 Tax=Acuticoccus sp. I52.16.1 TaxID=2928472 RepID=UPI001FD1AF29|nr:DNA polymerase III subunit delta' [Acuticoccus sp. I52.16.1]UOM34575.1 DNA polymerase III subunit delta' [Acuticoccus sp. I52.16.1]
MARAPRAPKPMEGAPAEPDMLDNAPPPREAQTLVGHGEAVGRLMEAFAAGTPPQAILLEGPRGIGKATLAFRLARALLSTLPGQPLPDDLWDDPQSRTAHQVAAGTHPGLVHLTRPWDEKGKKFKSELTVDEVRRIVPFLGSTAADGGWRVVIVDAVDDMNINASNALLKALEEPPRRTLFILVAHVSGRVMATIRSRCRAIRMRPLSEDEVRGALNALRADPSTAKLGEGSVRRALGLANAGADVVRSAQRLLAPSMVRDIRAQHQLAEMAAQRRDDAFATVLELVLDAIAGRAKHGAGRLPLPALDTYAALYLSVTDDRRRIEVFNLDRKEMVLAVLSRLSAADKAAGLT